MSDSTRTDGMDEQPTQEQIVQGLALSTLLAQEDWEGAEILLRSLEYENLIGLLMFAFRAAAGNVNRASLEAATGLPYEEALQLQRDLLQRHIQ